MNTPEMQARARQLVAEVLGDLGLALPDDVICRNRKAVAAIIGTSVSPHGKRAAPAKERPR